jgi:hypothetical protein
MKTLKIFFLASLVGTCALGFGSCGKSEDKGPMEKAGKAVDQTIDKAKETTGQAMEKAGEAIKEAGEKMREKKGQ